MSSARVGKNRFLVGGEAHVLVCREGDDGSSFAVESRLELGTMPSFLAYAEAASLVFAVVEGDDELAVLRFDAFGRLTLREKIPCPGGPAYVSSTEDGSLVLTASYGSGEVRVYAPRENGSYGLIAEAFAGENAHSVEWTGDDRSRLLVACKGADSLVTFEFDGRFLEGRRVHAAPSGSGPRHFVALGARLFVSGENDASLVAFERNGDALVCTGHWPLTPEGHAPGDTAADLHLSPDGRMLYASVRGRDSLVAFALDDASPTLVSELRLPGRVPRHFSLVGESRILVAEQETKTVCVVSRDDATGRLALVGQSSVGERAFFVRPWTSR